LDVKASNLETYGNREKTKNKTDLLSYLLPVLKSAGLSGRVYYESTCHSDDDHSMPLPKIKVKSPLKNQRPVDAVREILRNNKNFDVVYDRMGIIKIYIPKYRDKAMDIYIPVITFGKFNQYDSSLAINNIWQNYEVRRGLASLGKRSSTMPIDRIFPPPDERNPHLPESLKNISVDGVLDLISKTFNEVVFYGSCISGGRFTSYSYPISE